MPTHVGPNTFGEENLVFGYDLGDVSNSYKGEPTVNLHPNPEDVGSWTGNLFSNWINCAVTSNYAIAPNGTLTADRLGDGYSRYNTSITATPGQTYTFSVYLKNISLTDDFDVYAGWGLNGTLVSYGAIGAKVLISQLSTTEWKRFQFTATAPSSGINQVQFGIAPFIGYGANPSGTYILAWGGMIEQKSHATPYTTGTRSAIQGLLDLTGTSTINISTTSFDNSSQLIFDGSDDYITLSSTSHPTGSCSMEIVINHTHNFVGSRYLLYGANGTAFWVFFRGDWAGNLLYFTRRVTNSGNYGDSAWGYTTGIYQPVPANETMHLIFTHDTSSGEFKCYKNGILTRTVNGNLAAYGALNTTQQSHYIGGSPGDNLPMTLPLFKFYDRVLSSSEVLNNYNNIKRKYGI